MIVNKELEIAHIILLYSFLFIASLSNENKRNECGKIFFRKTTYFQRIFRGFFTNEWGKYTFDIIGIFVLPSA